MKGLAIGAVVMLVLAVIVLLVLVPRMFQAVGIGDAFDPLGVKKKLASIEIGNNLEKAIACAKVRCFEGCGKAKSIKWEGGTCAEFCDPNKLKEYGLKDDSKVCDEISRAYPVEFRTPETGGSATIQAEDLSDIFSCVATATDKCGTGGYAREKVGGKPVLYIDNSAIESKDTAGVGALPFGRECQEKFDVWKYSADVAVLAVPGTAYFKVLKTGGVLVKSVKTATNAKLVGGTAAGLLTVSEFTQLETIRSANLKPAQTIYIWADDRGFGKISGPGDIFKNIGTFFKGMYETVGSFRLPGGTTDHVMVCGKLPEARCKGTPLACNAPIRLESNKCDLGCGLSSEISESLDGWSGDTGLQITTDSTNKKLGTSSIKIRGELSIISNKYGVLNKFVEYKFNAPADLTKGIAFYTKSSSISNNIAVIQLTDNSGNEASTKKTLTIRNDWQYNTPNKDDFQLHSQSFDWSKVEKIKFEVGSDGPPFEFLWIDGLQLLQNACTGQPQSCNKFTSKGTCLSQPGCCWSSDCGDLNVKLGVSKNDERFKKFEQAISDAGGKLNAVLIWGSDTLDITDDVNENIVKLFNSPRLAGLDSWADYQVCKYKNKQNNDIVILPGTCTLELRGANQPSYCAGKEGFKHYPFRCGCPKDYGVAVGGGLLDDSCKPFDKNNIVQTIIHLDADRVVGEIKGEVIYDETVKADGNDFKLVVVALLDKDFVVINGIKEDEIKFETDRPEFDALDDIACQEDGGVLYYTCRVAISSTKAGTSTVKFNYKGVERGLIQVTFLES